MKKILCVIIIILNALIVNGQFFYKTNSFDKEEIICMSVETSKNNFLSVATFDGLSKVLKINKNGIVDSITFSSEKIIRKIEKINDNRFLISGPSFESNYINIFVAYIDSNLNILKSQKFFVDSFSNDIRIGMLQLEDYIYIHTYLFFQTPTLEFNNKVLKIDTSLTSVEYFSPLNGQAFLFNFTYYNNRFRFLYAGNLFYYYHVYDGILSYDTNFNLVKMDSVIWTWVGDIKIMHGNYVFTGIGPSDISLISLKDTFNNFIASKPLYDEQSVDSYLNDQNSLVSYDDFVYASTVYGMDLNNNTNYSSIPSYILVNKYDSNLNLRWRKFIGGDKHYYTYSINSTIDSGCVISGIIYDANWGNQKYDAFILVLDSLGNTISDVPDNAYLFDTALIYPNPGSSELNVLIPENIKTTTFELYNSVGVLCKEEQFDSDRLNLNTNELKSGLYFYRLRQGNNIVSQGKWVKE